MSVSVKPEHLRRYGGIARLLLKHGRRDLVSGALSEPGIDLEDGSSNGPGDHREQAEALAKDLESMGPTFVKLGQLLSTRADLLPDEYLTALTRLQDNVSPISFEEVRGVIEGELGFRLSKGFAEFDEKPLASASLGQVHRAVMRNGRQVAVKVQRPNIRGQIVDDLAALIEVAGVVDRRTEVGRRHGFEAMVDEFRRAMLGELDYRREAENLQLLGANLAEFEHLLVPSPVNDYTTDRVLTMDYIAGKNLKAMGPMGLMELDGETLADELFRAYLKQILVDGFFHADPHPGNVHVTEDGRLALIDLGMVARLSQDMRQHLVKLLLAVGEGRGSDAAATAIAISQRLEDFNRQEYTRRVTVLLNEHSTSSVSDIPAGRVVAELSRIGAECGLRLPPELTMLAKALLNLDEVGRTLAPDFDPNAALREQASDLVTRHLTDLVSPASLMSVAMDAKEFAEHLPSRLNAALDTLAQGEISLQVKGIDEHEFMLGMQKLANRVTAGLVIAALVIGASMLMRVETSARLFGYPALATVCFLTAVAAALFLLGGIFYGDRKTAKGATKGR
ncbi:MAG TPA: AarF/UbiB family protein [Acidimicrobiales bacterium]|nr:AarF/UbiB family protein [Acidimicrobiales bacterium]